MSTVTASVILPTYNRGWLLRESVASVLEQTVDSWELIIVDDGSTDGSVDTLRSDSRIRVVHIPHSGSPAVARNAGIHVATGEWVAFLDSDDLWRPEKLSRQLAALAEHPECGWSATTFSFIDADGRSIPQPVGRACQPYSGWVLERLVKREAYACMSTMLVRRSLLKEIGGFDEDRDILLLEDLDLAFRLAGRSQLCALGDELSLMREHAGRSIRGPDPLEALERQARLFRRVGQSTSNGTIRRLCRRQTATQYVGRAGVFLRASEGGRAVRELLRAMIHDPTYTLPWRVLGGRMLHGRLA